jgi:sialidase-1
MSDVSRRTFLIGSAASACLLGARRARAATSLRVDHIRTISPDADHYHGWPTMTRGPAGELLLVYSGGREEHVCPFGRVELMRSWDQGATWSWPQVLLDSPIDDRDAGICVTPQGNILVTTFTSLAYVPLLNGRPDEQRQRWAAAHARVNEPHRQRELGVWMIRSDDGGVTWSRRSRGDGGRTTAVCRQGLVA